MPDYSLSDIPVDSVHQAQQAAVVRLHLFVIGEIHGALAKVSEAGTAVLRQQQQASDEPVSVAASTLATQSMMLAWDEFINWYIDMMQRALITAGSLPFGVWGILHNEWIRPYVPEPVEEAVYESVNGRLILESIDPDVVFRPQLDSVVAAAKDRTYGDSVKLSQRIWNLDKYGRDGINMAVQAGIAEGKSAWQLAQDIELFLGAGKDCPRWTNDRLSTLTKKQIADGDRTGLYSGDECRGQGVSYNALRLARTEIQAILNDATTRNFKQMPWIEQEKINLSPAHAERDECDDVVEGGEDGNGEYPVGEITLGLHPHCMCYKTAVLAPPDEFTKRLSGWVRGEEQWTAMDVYHTTLQGELWTDLRNTAIGVSLAYWLWEEAATLDSIFWSIAMGG